MKRCIQFISIALTFLIVAFSISASSFNHSEDYLVRQIVLLYGYYQEEAIPQIEPLMEQLIAKNPAKGNQWQRILDYWRYTNTEITVNDYFPPDDLEDAENLCIVILGYKLTPSGAIYPELEGRLYTALSCALLYPDSMIVCTGGGTAKLNPGITEASQMSKWLIRNGISKDRIIIEDKSFTTGQNAENVYTLLRNVCPEVDSILIVTSDYHVPWASAVFQTACILNADQNGNLPLRVVTNVADKPKTHENYPFCYQAAGILELAGMTETAMDIYNGTQSIPKIK